MSKVNIRPLADRVLVEPLAAETTTASGLIIPDSAKEKPSKGIVIAVGTGHQRRSFDRKSWRYRFVWEICGHRTEARRNRLFDHERKRYFRNYLNLYSIGSTTE